MNIIYQALIYWSLAPVAFGSGELSNNYNMAGDGCSTRQATADCQNATCIDGDIRLSGEHSNGTAVSGGVDVCVGSGWRAVCNHEAWNSNTVQTANAKVACRQLEYREEGATNQAINKTAITSVDTTQLGLRQSRCTGTELRLDECPSTGDNGKCGTRASLTCQIDEPQCTAGQIRIAEVKSLEVCRSEVWNTCIDTSAYKDINVTQHGTYICGSTAQHFFTADNQLYECQIPDTTELLLCTPMEKNATNNCTRVLQDIELQAASSSITVTWGNTKEAQSFDNSSAEYVIACSPEGSALRHSIAVVPTTSEVTMENLPHSTTYECCVTLHIGRYPTRACSNTATLAGSDSTTTELPSVPGTTQSSTNNNQLENDAIQGAGLRVIIALGVLVAVLVLLLILATGAWLYLLITRGNKKRGENMAPASTNGTTHSTQGVRCFENPNYSRHELTRLTPPHSTPHPLTPPTPPPTVTLPAPPHTLALPTPPPTLTTPPFTTETPFDIQSEYSVIKPLERVDKNAKKITEEDYEKDQTPTYEVPIVSLETPRPAGERAPEEYSHLKH